MELTPKSGSQLAQNVNLTISEEEMKLAFRTPLIPANRELFVKRFSPEWESLDVSAQLTVLAGIAALVKSTQEAATIQGQAAAAVPKPPA